MNNIRIGIILPVYNVRNFLERCIASIMGQTLQEFEVILVDDGSSDGSGRLCDELSTRFSNITSYHIKNSGAGAARNYGIDMAASRGGGIPTSHLWIPTTLSNQPTWKNCFRPSKKNNLTSQYADIGYSHIEMTR